MEAVITGVEAFGLFAQGIELPAEGLIRVDALSDDYYHFDKKTHTLTGHRRGNVYRLGDIVEVEIAHVDVDRRELDFRVVRRLEKASGKPKLTARPKAKKKAAGKRRAGAKKKTARKTARRRKTR
jgi:ribonuclease R